MFIHNVKKPLLISSICKQNRSWWYLLEILSTVSLSMTLKTAGIRYRDNHPLPDAFCEVLQNIFSERIVFNFKNVQSESGEIEKWFLQDIVFSNKNFMPYASNTNVFLRFYLIIKSLHYCKNKKWTETLFFYL